MNLPLPPAVIAALAAFLRNRLANVTDTVGVLGDVVVVGAAAPFAANSFARARLIRQMHASGLVSGDGIDAEHHLAADAEAAPKQLTA
jgi:hypothetical protein